MSSNRALSNRALGRATLARQLLLGRTHLTVAEAVGRLLGLNGQDPDPPYLALWNRLDGFGIDDLDAARRDGEVVRSTMFRGTQFLATPSDFRLLRCLMTDFMQRTQRSFYKGQETQPVDLDDLVAEARELLADGAVVTRSELGRRLATSRPGIKPGSLGRSVQYLLPVVHPLPTGAWRSSAQALYALPDRWDGDTSDFDLDAGLDELIVRYLSAFGPASPADARVWSGIARLKPVFERLRPRLRTFTDEDGRELFDLPDAPLPDPDEPAPTRLLPRFDAVALSHANRARVMTDEVRAHVIDGSAMEHFVLLDGTVAGRWWLDASEAGGPAIARIQPLRSWSPAEHDEVEAEALRLLAWTDPGASAHRVDFDTSGVFARPGRRTRPDTR
jgi:CRISPR/Cas system-associated endoribonuclease Cas2